MKTQDDLTKKVQNDGPEVNAPEVSPKTEVAPATNDPKNPNGEAGSINNKGDITKNVGKGGKIGGTKAVNTTPDPVETNIEGSKSTDNLGAGEHNLTNNSTLNTVPAEPVEVKTDGPKCPHCKGEGLEDVENPVSPLCTVCHGSGRA